MSAVDRRRFVYSTDDLRRLDALSLHPVRVWNCAADFQRIFEANGMVLRASPQSQTAVTPNDWDEVITVALEQSPGCFASASSDHLLFESVCVERVCVLRTVLTYTVPVLRLTRPRVVLDDATPVQERIEQAIAGVIGSKSPLVHSEVLTHPAREKTLPGTHINIADAGFVLFTDHGRISCLAWMNGYTCGPPLLNDAAVADLERMYDFIPVRRLLLGAA